MVNTTKIDRVKGLTVPHHAAIVGHYQTGDRKHMAVAKTNARHKVTVTKNLLAVVEADAKERGLSISETMAMAIATYYANSGAYTQENTQWTKKLESQAA